MENSTSEEKRVERAIGCELQSKTVIVCTCLRCGHEWTPKGTDRPTSCARCRSRNWWLMAGELKSQATKLPKPNKYGLDALEVGQAAWLPQILTPFGALDIKAQASRNLSIRRYQRTSGRKFFIDWGYKDGKSILMVKRIA